MEDKLILNKEIYIINSIRVIKYQDLTDQYTFEKEKWVKKNWFSKSKLIPAGYKTTDGGLYSRSFIETHFELKFENDKIFKPAHVLIHVNSYGTVKKTFKTDQEAYDYANNLVKEHNLDTIDIDLND